MLQSKFFVFFYHCGCRRHDNTLNTKKNCRHFYYNIEIQYHELVVTFLCIFRFRCNGEVLQFRIVMIYVQLLQ